MTTYQSANVSQRTSAEQYVAAFEEWMDRWRPDVFATVNLPNRPSPIRKIRSHEFYLGLWTRIAECNLTSVRYVVHGNRKERMVWIFRGEISPDGLVHYHALAKASQRLKDDFQGQSGIDGFCESLKRNLKLASSRTPEPFRRPLDHPPLYADIDVRPAKPHHYRYLLKQVCWPSIYDHERVDSVMRRDSGLFIFPNGKGTSVLGKDATGVLVN